MGLAVGDRIGVGHGGRRGIHVTPEVVPADHLEVREPPSAEPWVMVVDPGIDNGDGHARPAIFRPIAHSVDDGDALVRVRVKRAHRFDRDDVGVVLELLQSLGGHRTREAGLILEPVPQGEVLLGQRGQHRFLPITHFPLQHGQRIRVVPIDGLPEPDGRSQIDNHLHGILPTVEAVQNLIRAD